MGVEQQRREGGEQPPGEERLARALALIVAPEPQGPPAERGGEQRHPHLGAARAGEPVGRREQERQHQVVPRVDLSFGAERIARLGLEGAADERPRVLGGVVVGQVGVEIVGEAVGDEQVVGLVAVRQPPLGRPGQQGQVEHQGQGEERPRGAPRQPAAEQREEAERQTRSAEEEQDEETGGGHLLPEDEPEPLAEQGQGEERRERRGFDRGRRTGAAPHSRHRRDLEQRRHDPGKQEEGRAQLPAAAGQERQSAAGRERQTPPQGPPHRATSRW